MFFISDIHRRKIDDKLLAKIQSAHEIDVVIIGGDLAEKGVPLTRIAKNIRKLAQLGRYFMCGVIMTVKLENKNERDYYPLWWENP